MEDLCLICQLRGHTLGFSKSLSPLCTLFFLGRQAGGRVVSKSRFSASGTKSGQVHIQSGKALDSEVGGQLSWGGTLMKGAMHPRAGKPQTFLYSKNSFQGNMERQRSGDEWVKKKPLLKTAQQSFLLKQNPINKAFFVYCIVVRSRQIQPN